jgi:hypothetical protein
MQQVAGISIDYPVSFTADPKTANKWISNNPQIRSAVISFEIFVAPARNGLAEVRIIKSRLKTDSYNINNATAEASTQLAKLEGITNFQSQTSVLKVSGREARQLSFLADRMGGKVGGEFLIIFDKKNSVTWQIQTMFAKQKKGNSTNPLILEAERKYAMGILTSVRVNP